MKTRAIPFILSLWLLAFVLSIQEVQAKTLRVATRETPPFSFKREGGILRGISIELWEKIAAADHLSFELEETTIEQLLKGLQDGT
jgi:polar amino acid transport system substrate-binding protein